MQSKLLLTALALILISISAQAEVYKWTDKKGKLHFSDHPVQGAEVQQGGNVSRVKNQTYNLASLRTEIPYSLQHGSMLVEALVNGKTQTFVVDTGASFVTIPPQLAERANISTERAKLIQLQTANGVITAPMVDIQHMSILSAERQQVKAVIAPIDAQGKLGLLGMSFLGAFRMNIDHDRRMIILEPRS
ncbi:MAG: hypothetical protein AUJ57_07850 [Zetaproteobacteria bacterium CG1_02_53_45]|nr:MAG: hypothetical protein AUJ57_07850 [Zetaproteobacteria bacterium CG1_02_53_45]